MGRRSARMLSVVGISATLLAAPACSSGGHKTASWRPVEFHGVQVEIPTAWKPVRANECGFQLAERYPDSTICDRTPGVGFYGRALFDPYRLPGIARTNTSGKAVWSGYIYRGDFAVVASGGSRELVQRVLDSAVEVGSDVTPKSSPAATGTVHARLFVTGGPPPGLRRLSSAGTVSLGGPEPLLPLMMGKVGRRGTVDFQVKPGRYSVGGKMGSVSCVPNRKWVRVVVAEVVSVDIDCSIK